MKKSKKRSSCINKNLINKCIVLMLIVVLIFSSTKTINVQVIASDTTTNLLSDGGFEVNIWDSSSPWDVISNSSVSINTYDYTTDAWIDPYDGNYGLNYWINSSSVANQTFTISQTVTGLEEGYYTFSGYLMGENNSVTLSAETTETTTGIQVSATAWNTWLSATCDNIHVVSGQALTLKINVDGKPNGYGYLDGFFFNKKSFLRCCNSCQC